MEIEGDWTLGGEHTMQCANDVLESRTIEACLVSLTSVTPIDSIQKCIVNILNVRRCLGLGITGTGDLATLWPWPCCDPVSF